MNEDDLRKLLSKLRKTELQKLAERLDIDYPKTANVRELTTLLIKAGVDEVLRAMSTPQSPPSRFDSLFPNEKIPFYGFVVTIVGVIFTIAGFWFGLFSFLVARSDLAPKPLDVDIVWYEMKDGRPQLLADNTVYVTIDDHGFKERAMSMPVNLAVRNRTGEMLEVVSVQITYPNWAKVQSQGKGKIDPNGGSIVYSHQIDTLPSIDEFTPLETIDTLTIPFPVQVRPVLFESREGVPSHEWTLWGGPKHGYEGKELKLRFRVDCKGHKPMLRDLNLNVPEVFGVAGSMRRKPVLVEIGKAEAESAVRLIDQAKEELTSWTGQIPQGGSTIRFSRNRSGKSVIQIVRVNDVVRRTNVDQDGDGFVDFDYLDYTGDGIADHKITYENREEMVDWHPDSVKSVNPAESSPPAPR